jgi:hypothetical protein
MNVVKNNNRKINKWMNEKCKINKTKILNENFKNRLV